MHLGMIGLGRMGANMALRLGRAGQTVVGYDPSAEARARHAAQGARVADSLDALVDALPAPRAVWIMVPSGPPVDDTVAALVSRMAAGDTMIDGGNSNYKDSRRRHAALAATGVRFVDVGTSGGIWGLENGYCLMVGGDAEAVEALRPVFESLAPAPDRGWGHVGPSGAGHYTKMIHNGIEYGLMQAYAEGFELLRAKTDLAIDVHQVAEIWRNGSVVRSWLLDLLAAALRDDPALSGIQPWVADSGEGRWTVAEAIDLDVPAPVITLSLMMRFVSRQEDRYAARALAALRNQFGGHTVKKAP